jgi:hypothetical protein
VRVGVGQGSEGTPGYLGCIVCKILVEEKVIEKVIGAAVRN